MTDIGNTRGIARACAAGSAVRAVAANVSALFVRALCAAVRLFGGVAGAFDGWSGSARRCARMSCSSSWRIGWAPAGSPALRRRSPARGCSRTGARPSGRRGAGCMRSPPRRRRSLPLRAGDARGGALQRGGFPSAGQRRFYRLPAHRVRAGRRRRSACSCSFGFALFGLESWNGAVLTLAALPAAAFALLLRAPLRRRARGSAPARRLPSLLHIRAVRRLFRVRGGGRHEPMDRRLRVRVARLGRGRAARLRPLRPLPGRGRDPVCAPRPAPPIPRSSPPPSPPRRLTSPRRSRPISPPCSARRPAACSSGI